MLKLTGPHARKSYDGYSIEIWTVRDQEDRWIKGDREKLRKLASDAYGARLTTPDAPNPALVPLDPDEEGGPYVYALITLVNPHVLRPSPPISRYFR